MAAYGVELGMDRTTGLKIANAFGGGIGRMGQTCGAVTGALMIISLKYGASDPDDEAAKEKTRELVSRFINEFKSRNDSLNCRDLLGFIIGHGELSPEAVRIIHKRCPGFVKDASEIIEGII